MQLCLPSVANSTELCVDVVGEHTVVDKLVANVNIGTDLVGESSLI